MLGRLHHAATPPRSGATKLAQRPADRIAGGDRAGLISAVERERLSHHADVFPSGHGSSASAAAAHE
ncbi:hypothetical protein OG342_00235 [Streptomyces bobili]|uniref:hypothetical protein n=1 Tax=Streptomyces bobili TaxID=67280 RepID=UPI0022585580|nr:hypothetical protein [Streptomyces bobili]MCX5521329.1 hypothetical protein [Streptomyces bobili]